MVIFCNYLIINYLQKRPFIIHHLSFIINLFWFKFIFNCLKYQKMSIPKEPRQLMINLMYLVLTAMLALNVSAEIINAFFRIDKSIVGTNSLLDDSNKKSQKSMDAEVKNRPEDKPLADAAVKASAIVKEFNDYITTVRGQLDEAAGGLVPMTDPDKTKAGKPVRYKDKDVPQRFFVEGGKDEKGNKFDANGPKIKAKVLETREKLLGLISGIGGLVKGKGGNAEAELKQMKDQLPLNIDENDWKTYGKKSWEQFTFGYMPVAACYPILSKFQNDARTAEAAIINYLASKVGANVIQFDKFEPVSAAEKGYVISGEKFTSEIFLSASSQQLKSGMSYRVDGSSLPIKDGKGIYEATASGVGEKTYKVDISLTNPFTGKTDNFSKQFKYEVGQRSVACSADKMNVIYIGVDNPISVAAAGVSSNALQVSGSGCSLKPNGNGKYIATATTQGTAKISVSGGGLNQTFDFRVKLIPNPVPTLSMKKGGGMGSGEMGAQAGIIPVLEGFDFDAKCSIQSFTMVRVPRREDPVPAVVNGGVFDEKAQRLVQAAKPGDLYNFYSIKARCPGDAIARDIGGMNFFVK
jgi:gliding motility-associated protein GldM